MFKLILPTSIKKLRECFKPYKGNVQMNAKMKQKWQEIGFKPYKGNVQIKLETYPDQAETLFQTL